MLIVSFQVFELLDLWRRCSFGGTPKKDIVSADDLATLYKLLCAKLNAKGDIVLSIKNVIGNASTNHKVREEKVMSCICKKATLFVPVKNQKVDQVFKFEQFC